MFKIKNIPLLLVKDVYFPLQEVELKISTPKGLAVINRSIEKGEPFGIFTKHNNRILNTGTLAEITHVIHIATKPLSIQVNVKIIGLIELVHFIEEEIEAYSPKYHQAVISEKEFNYHQQFNIYRKLAWHLAIQFDPNLKILFPIWHKADIKNFARALSLNTEFLHELLSYENIFDQWQFILKNIENRLNENNLLEYTLKELNIKEVYKYNAISSKFKFTIVDSNQIYSGLN